MRRMLWLMVALCSVEAGAQKVVCKGSQFIGIQGDTVNFIMRTDGSQYRWAGARYAWGGVDAPQGISTTKTRRQMADGSVRESFTMVNNSTSPIRLGDVGINTPWNDNYPSAKECIAGRVNAHVWAEGSSAYICATRMSGRNPSLALVVTKGALSGYEIKGRSMANNMSNVRGIIVVNPEDVELAPQQRYTIEWTILAHEGWSDFFEKAKQRGAVVATADRYVVERGEGVEVSFKSASRLKHPTVSINGGAVDFVQRGGEIVVAAVLDQLGDAVVELRYDGNRHEVVRLLCISSAENIVAQRAEFLVNHQQYLNQSDKRYGAYMVYDNERGEIFANDRKTVSYYDRDEGAERLGMGIFLAQWYNKTTDGKILASLQRYMKFVRQQLQTQDYTTYSTYQNEGRNRAYNYPWIAHLNVEMYKATLDTQYLRDCYGTLSAMYRHFGHDFYAFGIPVRDAVELMRGAGMGDCADSLMTHFKAAAQIYLANGTNYPPHEVNYEQTIVAPLVMLLTQLYQLTADERYMAEVVRQMPLLESFAGFQPDYHLNQIGIRHWDGYWFGKRETWGDTFPHYWTTLTAQCYSLYAQCTADRSYQQRAENIVRNNLCQFFEDGSASCAYIYPRKVNGQKGKFYDPFANDQDFALVYYMEVLGKSLSFARKEVK